MGHEEGSVAMVKKTPASCFLFGVTGPGWSQEDDALIGSVSDDPYDIRTFVKVVKPPQGFNHTGTELVSTTEHSLTERGYFARPGETTRGINEAGLAFTCAMVIEEELIEKPCTTTNYAKVTGEMLKTCASVEVALKLFQSVGTINPPYSVLLADANGDLAHIEVGNFGMAIIACHSKEKPGVVHAVNCYQAPELVDYNAPHTSLSNLDNNNLARLERGCQLTEEFRGRLSVDNIARILSDHVNRERDPMKNQILEAWGYSICNHGTRSKHTYPEEDLPWGTVSAEIMQPSRRLFWYAYGWPCGEAPEFGDQLFQERSWGRFVPFVVETAGEIIEQEITSLTTADGMVTPEGVRHLSFPQQQSG